MTTESKNNSPRPWEYGAAFLFLAAVVLMLMLNSCSPRIIEHVVVQRDTVKVVKLDSIWNYQHDSVFVREKGDTVYKYVEHVRYRDRVRVDTFVRVKIDSVAVERVKEVKVQQPLSWWQKFRQVAFWWLVSAVILLLVWTFRKVIFKIMI